MLSIYRRHLHTCPHAKKGRAYMRCECPLWCDGTLKGRRVRESLDTVNMDRARRRAARREAEILGEFVQKPVSEAVAAFLSDRQRDVEPSTLRRYGRALRPLAAYANAHGIEHMDCWRLEDLDGFKHARGVSALTWSKELELIRSFFRFCLDRQWCEKNPAAKMRGPKNPRPRPRQPYRPEEITRILAAADSFGRGAYERLRAKAMLLLMLRYGLRVSDVATLRKDRIKNGEVHLYAAKNGNSVWAPLWPDVKAALDILPLPWGADYDCPYYFWTGLGDRDSHIKTVDRTLQAVFRESGVERASAHRFRHTLAVQVLVSGGTIEDAASILGDSPAVVRKHYLPWCSAFQSRINEVLLRVHGAKLGTPLVHGKNWLPSLALPTDRVVPEVGVEPT